MAYENQNIQLINDNGQSLLGNSVCNNLVKNYNTVHNNNNTHIVIYAILPCISDVGRHNIILFYKWDHMYPGWSL